MKDWKDKALEDSFPEVTMEQFEQREKAFVKKVFKLVILLVVIAAFIYLIFFTGIPFPPFDLRTWLLIGIVAVCIQLERIIRLMPRR